MTTLADLFPEARGSEHAGRTVSGLTADSRKVRPGSVFVAVPGTKADGAAFIPQALAAGAMAIVGEAERPATLNAAIAYLRVADVRRALALAAARFFPRQPETVVAVTGTSGKSSVADFRAPALRRARPQIREPRHARRRSPRRARPTAR